MNQLSSNFASKANLSSALISPVRCRQAADLVRGKSLSDADRLLSLEKVKAAKIILKLIRSAMANALQKGVADLDRLFISDLQVNEGPRIKKFMPRAHGRADKRLTRTSHVSVVLAERKVSTSSANFDKTKKVRKRVSQLEVKE